MERRSGATVAQGCVRAPANPPAVHFTARMPLSALLLALLASGAVLPGSEFDSVSAQSVSVVTAGATDDATASNNQVKVIHDRAGQLIVAYTQNVSGTPQVMLAASQDEGRHW